MSRNSPTPLSHSLYSVEDVATKSRVLWRGREGGEDEWAKALIILRRKRRISSEAVVY